ncbi:MAG: hypothetical protein JWQ19_2652 [Subtercola sp.]|nr:hypothetical protein [Subtercola sp.]
MAMVEAGKGVRAGSAHKRAAILGAARELFLADGFERTSVDAIAARAGVSKRTVYDYYGEKRALLLAVVEQAMDSLISAIQRSVDDNLTDDLTSVEGLRSALVGFARSVTESALGSSDYSALMRLVSAESANLPELEERVTTEPEDLVSERFLRYGRRGLLEVPNPRLAADHFVALTMASTASAIGRPVAQSDASTRQMIADGVDVFLRAYTPR